MQFMLSITNFYVQEKAEMKIIGRNAEKEILNQL